eukprot:3892039-Alexandrium_andersonii.AAC.1
MEMNSVFNVFYVCKAGPKENKCNTCASSKIWGTLNEDPISSKQRWCCKNCGARYKPKHGVVLEIIDKRPVKFGQPRKYLYCRAAFPPRTSTTPSSCSSRRSTARPPHPRSSTGPSPPPSRSAALT